MDLLPKACKCQTQNPIVVESEGRDFRDGEPSSLSRIVTALNFLSPYQGVMCNRDYPSPRVTAYLAEGVELLDEGVLKSGLLPQLALSSSNCILIHIEETSRERPSALERLYSPLYQKNLQVPSVISEYHAVRGDSRTWIIVCVSAFVCHTCKFYTKKETKFYISKKLV